jgi:ribosome-associated translation inhibitor RaiA
MSIIYNRLKDLNAAETQEVKRLSEQAYEKVQRDLFGSKLVVDVHKFEKAGARAKYSIHFRVEHPSTLLTAEEADWELAKALHKTIANLTEEVRKKARKETKKTGPKPYPV